MAGAYLLGAFGTSNSRPWLFKGAYATYSGQTNVGETTYNLTLGEKVLDFNSTYVHLQLNLSISTGSSLGSFNNQTTQWVKLNTTATGFYTLGNATLSKTYDATRTVMGKALDCTAYEYTQSNSTVTIYVSKSAGFPVEITAASSLFGSTFAYDLQLVSTNIPGL